MKAEFTLTPSVVSALNIMAERQNRKPDEIVADLITAHYEAQPFELDDNILDDLRCQRDEIKRSGAVDYDQGGRAWIESWKSKDKKQVPPKCPV